jgi:hypothetical protein
VTVKGVCICSSNVRRPFIVMVSCHTVNDLGDFYHLPLRHSFRSQLSEHDVILLFSMPRFASDGAALTREHKDARTFSNVSVVVFGEGLVCIVAEQWGLRAYVCACVRA